MSLSLSSYCGNCAPAQASGPRHSQTESRTLFLALMEGFRSELVIELGWMSSTDTTSDSFFAHYEGRQECGVSSADLYVPAKVTAGDHALKHAYCPNRAAVMEAMTGGGRHGFDALFSPKGILHLKAYHPKTNHELAGCQYRWYTTEEICMILERFDAIIFVGDRTLQNIYSAFNILLRENMALGALKQWDMAESDMKACRCDNQYINQECFKFVVTSSEMVQKYDGRTPHKSPYFCERTLSITPNGPPLPS
jgi:hypothetical protein